MCTCRELCSPWPDMRVIRKLSHKDCEKFLIVVLQHSSEKSHSLPNVSSVSFSSLHAALLNFMEVEECNQIGSRKISA